MASPSPDDVDFERVTEAVGTATYVQTPAGEIIYANSAFEDLTGYSVAEILGKTPVALTTGKHSEEDVRNRWQTLDTGDVWTGEVVNCRKNGTHYTAHQTISPIVSDGEIAQFVVTQTDVTEQSARENRLRQYERAIEGTHDLVAAVGTDSRFLFANSQYRTFHDIERADLVDATLEDVLDPEVFELVKPKVERVLAGETVSYQMTRESADGDEEVLSVRYYPLRDEEDTIDGVVTAMRPITDILERTQELERSRDLLARTEQLGDVGGWEYETETEELRWTAGTRRLHDAPETYQPSISEALDFQHHEHRDKVERVIQNCLTDGISYDIRTRLVTAEGRNRWVRTTGERVQRGEKTMLQGAVIDVTKQVQRQKQLAVLNRVLRHNLRNDLNTVIGYAEILGDELDEISTLDTAGDARSPLEVLDRVSAAGELSTRLESELSEIRDVLEQLSSAPSDTALEGARIIKENSESLVEIAGKAREFERYAGEKQVMEAVSVRSVLEDAAASYRSEFPEAAIEVVGDEASVRANPAALRRILDELIENALQHTTKESPTVVLRARASSTETVTVRIEDTGPGIPEMEQKTIEQGEETALMHGSGIGLWLVSWLVTQFDGTVDIEENDPRGTIVSLQLPAVE